MEIILIMGVLVFIWIAFPRIACAIANIHLTLFYAPIDLYYYIKHKKYNELKTGELVAVNGLFGKGKTLSVVHMIAKRYYSKNNKMVWCSERKKYVRQRVLVLSNVHLVNIPYVKFVSLSQIVDLTSLNPQYDEEHNTRTVTLVLGDEFSVQLNSRNFKSNIDALFLNSLLCCRHFHLSIYYTAQRFGHVDALLRQVTSYCIECNKLWRLQGINYYDAWQLENASSPEMVKPYMRSAWFVRNKDYQLYNTFAVVENLKKSYEEGDMIPQYEIMVNQAPNNSDNIIAPSRKYKKMLKKINK